MTVIVDYGVGNLFSLKCSFNSVGEQAIISKNKDDILKADRIVLPGVGAFSDSAKKLKERGYVSECNFSLKRVTSTVYTKV